MTITISQSGQQGFFDNKIRFFLWLGFGLKRGNKVGFLNVKAHKTIFSLYRLIHKFWNWPCHQLLLRCSEILKCKSDNNDVDLFQNRPPRCDKPRVCNLWHKSGVRYMRTCQRCPDIYPWTGRTGVANSLVDRL